HRLGDHRGTGFQDRLYYRAADFFESVLRERGEVGLVFLRLVLRLWGAVFFPRLGRIRRRRVVSVFVPRVHAFSQFSFLAGSPPLKRNPSSTSPFFGPDFAASVFLPPPGSLASIASP